MITVTIFKDVFDPTSRDTHKAEARDGLRLDDLVPESINVPGLVAWINGRLTDDLRSRVRDGDYVHFAVAPTGPLVPVLPYIFTALAVAAVGYSILKTMAPKQQNAASDDLGSGTYGYYGFRNSYRSEGQAIPVVYGLMRYAPPCMNQSVTGQSAYDLLNNSLINSRVETLNAQFCLSHGPIAGLGSFTGDVYDKSTFEAVTGSSPSVKAGAGLQINGVDASGIPSTMEWRTGLLEQTSISGLPGQLDTNDPGTTYGINFEFTVGTSSIDESSFPPGVYTYGTAITEGDPTLYVKQFINTEADIADVQFFFERGLFSGADDGSPNNKTAIFRVQYYQTDVSGTSTSDVVVLPEIRITSDSLSPFSVDYLFDLFDPQTYEPPEQQGYAFLGHRAGSATDYTLNISDENGLSLIQPGSGNNDPSPSFTFSAWVAGGHPDPVGGSMILYQWCSDTGALDAEVANNNFGNPYDGTAVWYRTEEFYGSTGGGFQFYNTWNSRSGMVKIMLQRGKYVDANTVDGPNGPWHLKVVFSDLIATGVSGARKQTRWISQSPVAPSATSFRDQANPALITVAYDHSTYELRAYIDGGEIPMQPYNSSVGSTAAYPETYARPNFNIITGQTTCIIGAYGPLSSTIISRRANEDSVVRISQVLMTDGILLGSFAALQSWALLAYTTKNQQGNYIYDIRALANDPTVEDQLLICSPLDDDEVYAISGSSYYQNLADENYDPATSDESAGAFRILYPGNTPQSDGFVWYDDTGESSRGYYYVEVFKQSPTTDSNEERDVANLDTITVFSTQDFAYPGIAYASTRITGTDQINNSEPSVTMLVKGKKVPIWQGGEQSNIVYEWSDNPAWVALDLLSNQDYGLGGIFNKYGDYRNFDLSEFREWADFCDEGVADGFGSLNFFSIKALTVSPTLDDYRIILRYGVVDTSGVTQQLIPDSWISGRQHSITNIQVGGASASWKTSDDVVGGKNNSSNRLTVRRAQYFAADDYHGWDGYFELELDWNRRSSAGGPDWPDGLSTGEELFADDYSGLTYLGSGSGYEARCRFDGVFDQANNAGWDAVLDIFQCGRAIPVKVGSKIVPVWDRPRDPVGLFSMSNIGEGSFQVNYLSPDTNPNSLEMEILDRDQNYERKTILVDHPTIQDPSKFDSFRRERFARPGVVRKSQATRDAYYRLNKYQLIRRNFTFKVGPDALHIVPGDRILVAHDVPYYGVSGRLPADFSRINTHPGAISIFDSWTQQGGVCGLTKYSLAEESAETPPISGYDDGVTLLYSLPVNFDGETYRLSSLAGSGGYNETPSYVGEYVANTSSLYPFPDSPLTVNSYLDIIRTTNDVKEFSVYLKEPDEGATQSVVLSIYRYVNDSGFVQARHGVRFDWSSGALVFGAYVGENTGTSSPYGMSYTITSIGSGWYRAVVYYDNGDTGNGGAGATGRGDYVQARLSFAYDDSSNESYLASPDGRGSNLLRHADPLNVDGIYSASSVWTKVNDSVGSNAIDHDTSTAPPFYVSDTGASAGKRGYVLNLKNSEAISGSPPCIYQPISLATNWPGGSGIGNMANEKICLTFFVRVASDNVASNPIFVARISTSSSTGSSPSGWLDEDYVQYAATLYGTPAISYTEQETTKTFTNVASSIAAVRLNSTSNDADWYQVNATFSVSSDYPSLYVNLGAFGNTGGICSVDVWGVRIHGEGGTGTTGAYVNENTHRGILAWGPQYNADSDGTQTAWSDGGTIQLDRDVTLEAGNEYEIYLRSSSLKDTLIDSEVNEVIKVSQSEVPSSGSTVISARTNIKVQSPQQMTPLKGDVYSFGQTQQSVEDAVVTSIDIDAQSLERTIQATEYVEEVYDDTAFGTISDPTISYAPPPLASAPFGIGSTFGNDAFAFNVTPAPYRGNNADAKTAIEISIIPPRGAIGYSSVRLYISEIDSGGNQSAPKLFATIRGGDLFYRYEDDSLRADRKYRIYAQRVGSRGTGLPVSSCPYQDITPVRAPRLPAAPTVAIATDGFSQVYELDPSQDKAVKSIEGRIGGWIISSPAYAGDPGQGLFTTLSGIAIGATNSNGETNFDVYSRATLANGRYGIAAVTPHSTEFVDFEDSDEETAEDDYSSIMAVPVGLTVTPGGVLTWQAASSLLEVNCPMTTIYDLGTARRVLPVALIKGYQVRPETLADCTFALGDDTGRRWSLEGPMDDPGATKDNASVKIEWRWSSTGSVASEDWVPFRPQEVYFRTCQFRLVWTRPTADYQVRLQRFATKLYVAPKFEPEDIDGGTF
jgi:hypothetical protein